MSIDPRATDSLVTLLARVPFLSQLSEGDLRALAHAGDRVSAHAGQMIFSEGETQGGLFVIISGRVQIFRLDPSGERIVISTLGPGEFFGEIALIDGGGRSASAVAIEASQFYVFERADFLALLARSPHMMASLFSTLTSKIRTASERYVKDELAARSLQGEMERKRLQSLAQMVSGVAHEINTPLGIIATAASVITREACSAPMAAAAAAEPAVKAALADIQEAAALMHASIAKASRLVHSFKSISIDEIADRKEALDLCATIVAVVDLYRLSARQARLSITVEDALPPGVRTWVGYEGLLSQIILNLVTNIQRYAYVDGAPGSAQITVGVDPDHPATHFLVTVRDFGQGIPSEHLPRVFDAFFTTGRGRGGTGLGLTLVHNIITTALEGRIAIASEPGRGTTITIWLPQVVQQGGPSAIGNRGSQ